jgi:UDP:flavonoid glycosyltransferase YjiC (YdhE family)
MAILKQPSYAEAAGRIGQALAQVDAAQAFRDSVEGMLAAELNGG